MEQEEHGVERVVWQPEKGTYLFICACGNEAEGTYVNKVPFAIEHCGEK